MSTMPVSVSPSSIQHDPLSEKIAAVTRRIDAGEGDLSLNALAKHVDLSPFSLQRAFKRILGVSPHEYATARKLERFRESLLHGSDVTTATYSAGFNSSSRVYEKTARSFGMAPRDYTRRGAAQAIHFAIATAPIGQVLVAATERGVCSIALGPDADGLEARMRAQFKNATITRTPPTGALVEAIEFILSQLTEHPAALTLPLDLRATAFQQRVWSALMEIPRGETRSYSEIARSIGKPTAARAVARAIASNPIALAIPCHRVIGADGHLTGFRWGVELKAKLLAMENTAKKHV